MWLLKNLSPFVATGKNVSVVMIPNLAAVYPSPQSPQFTACDAAKSCAADPEGEGAAALPGQRPRTAGNESAEPVSKHRTMDSCFEPSLINFFSLFLLIQRQMHQLASSGRKYHHDYIKVKICPEGTLLLTTRAPEPSPAFSPGQQDTTQLATSKG